VETNPRSELIRRLIGSSVDLVWSAELPFLPPSINNSYKIIKMGSRYTLGAAPALAKFKSDAAKALAYYPVITRLDPTDSYLLVVMVSVERLETSTFGKASGAKSRWRKIDSSNMLKSVEDAVVRHTGLDDSSFLAHTVLKKEGPSGTSVHLYREAV
jgi:hypothetical protein